MPDRPVITAHWRNLLLLNFAVPADAVAPLVPPGTEPDVFNNQSFISIVGFIFDATRLFGVPIPGHTRFAEINLRYYVRRVVCNEVRRGVVFVREIVPRRAVALTANWLYNENYIARPMRSEVQIAGNELSTGDTVEYAWRTKRPLPLRNGPGEGSGTLPSPGSSRFRLRLRNSRWNRLAARVAAPLALPAKNSLEEFFVEHYWGYVRARDGTSREYQVVHDPWQTAPADNVVWDCDVSATYRTPLAPFLAAPPTSAFIAAGSNIKLYRGRQFS